MPKGVFERRRKHGHALPGQHTKTYKRWTSMKHRCFNPNDANYKHYGGRGITVCERWLDFRNFLADMGEAPEGMWIDRIDNDKGYEPGNCKWVTPKEQLRNRRNNYMVEVEGVTKCLSEWAEYLGVDVKMLDARIRKYGWDPQKAVMEPKHATKGRPKSAVRPGHDRQREGRTVPA
jgi:hypothetical protein